MAQGERRGWPIAGRLLLAVLVLMVAAAAGWLMMGRGPGGSGETEMRSETRPRDDGTETIGDGDRQALDRVLEEKNSGAAD